MPERPARTAFTLRRMRPADLRSVALVHRDAFRGFFLDQMGVPFLRQYYASILAYDRPVAVVAVSGEGKIIGFAAGFHSPADFYRHFRSRRLGLLPATLIAVLRKPSLMGRILANSRRVSTPAQAEAHVCELASIGVSGRGAGVGSDLLEAFCSEAFASGAQRVRLSTDADDNEATRTFYERRNFTLTGEERRQDRLLCLYERTA